MLDFLNSKLVESNTEFSLSQKRMVKIKNNLRFIANVPHKVLGKVKNIGLIGVDGVPHPSLQAAPERLRQRLSIITEIKKQQQARAKQ